MKPNKNVILLISRTGEGPSIKESLESNGIYSVLLADTNDKIREMFSKRDYDMILADFSRDKDKVDFYSTFGYTDLELKLLNIFIENKGKVISKKYLAKTVWEWEDTPSTTVSSAVNRLRRKVGKDKIKCVRGKGYKYL